MHENDRREGLQVSVHRQNASPSEDDPGAIWILAFLHGNFWSCVTLSKDVAGVKTNDAPVCTCKRHSAYFSSAPRPSGSVGQKSHCDASPKPVQVTDILEDGVFAVAGIWVNVRLRPVRLLGQTFAGDNCYAAQKHKENIRLRFAKIAQAYRKRSASACLTLSF
jgi:hypothetical protein